MRICLVQYYERVVCVRTVVSSLRPFLIPVARGEGGGSVSSQ